MCPESELLARLGDDVSHLERVAVHCVYTPFDALIVPATSSILRGARSVHRVPVLIHRLMLSDRRVHDIVATALRTGHGAPACP
jgi:triacylglycerol lipase